jgi:hypothetical protein
MTPDTPQSILMPWGYVEFSNNEVSIISTVNDPPKVRMASAEGGSLGACSFGVLRTDGRQEEVILIQGKRDERWRNDLSGELTIHIRDHRIPGDDASMVKVMEMRADRIVFCVPVSPRGGVV